MKPKTWFSGRTYHHRDFKNINKLLELKRDKGMKISLAIPTLNEEKTVGKILEVVLEKLVRQHPLLDQVAVIDSRSEDGTKEIAKKIGAEVYDDAEIRQDLGTHAGKGEALWKSLFVLNGDIIIWVDADIENFESHFVTGIIGPLLFQEEIGFSKAFYRRPLKGPERVRQNEGGRVTEILARPLLNLFYPDLSFILQPLSGEYGGKKNLLMSIPFFTGFAVEIGMLIELYKKFGLQIMAQVDLEERLHHNKPTVDLGKMGFGIAQGFIQLLEEDKKISLHESPSLEYKIPRQDNIGYQFEKYEREIIRRQPAVSFLKND